MFDSNNILGQKEDNGQFGGGDSASWHGAYTLLGQEPRSFRNLFEVGFGAYVRHPSEGYSAYYKHPYDGRISRDQLSGILSALAYQKDRIGLLRAFIHHGARLWAFDYATRQNGQLSDWKFPDITLPNIFTIYIRGILGKFSFILYPILLLGDLIELINIWNIKRTNTYHIISWLIRMITIQRTSPTFISNIAFKYISSNDLESKLKAYWCGFRGNCFMVDLYMKEVRKLKDE